MEVLHIFRVDSIKSNCFQSNSARNFLSTIKMLRFQTNGPILTTTSTIIPIPTIPSTWCNQPTNRCAPQNLHALGSNNYWSRSFSASDVPLGGVDGGCGFVGGKGEEGVLFMKGWFFWIEIWVFPKIGVPPCFIHFNRVFHYFHHPFWGTPIFGNIHMFLTLGLNICPKYPQKERMVCQLSFVQKVFAVKLRGCNHWS